MNSNLIEQTLAARSRKYWLRHATRVATIGLALIYLMLPLNAEEYGQRCSNATLKGAYGALVSGVRGIGPGVTEMFAGTALRKYDGAGAFSELGNQHGAITGTVVNGQASGTYQVNPDCTGTSTLVLPPPFPTVVSSFVIVDSGREVREIVMSPDANIVTATLRMK